MPVVEPRPGAGARASEPEDASPPASKIPGIDGPEVAPGFDEWLLLEAERVGRCGAWLWDLRDGRDEWSDGMRAILGAPADVRPCLEAFLRFVHPDDRERIMWFVNDAVAAREASFEMEFRIVRPDGAQRTVLSRGQLWFAADGTPERVTGFIQDLTERIAAAEALRVASKAATRAQADAEAARAEAEAARADAEASSRAKDDLLAVVSHELRAPLAPARALAQLLARADGLSADNREMAAEIERHIAHEARLVENLIEYEGAHRHLLEVQCEHCDVHSATGQALRGVESMLQEKRISIALQLDAVDPVAWADRLRVQQIVYNLLRNAVQFSVEGARVVLRSHNPAPDWIEVSIADSGRGIAPEDLPRLFEPFVRVGSGPRSGLGLGLAFSRRVAGLQGGRLTAASEGRGLGATFTLRLPTARAASASIHAMRAGRSAAASSGPTTGLVADGARALDILVLEDDADAARALRRLLGVHGHDVQIAETLDELERIAAAEPLDLVIADVQLATESGLAAPARLAEAARRLGTPAPPAIVLSGYNRSSDLAQSRAAGFVAHLTKPVDEEELLRALQLAVEGAAERAS